jgi:hypothetical protein
MRTTLAVAALLATSALAARAADDKPAAKHTEQEAYEIAKDAYVHAYPLVLQDLTIRQLNNYAVPPGFVEQGRATASVMPGYSRLRISR